MAGSIYLEPATPVLKRAFARGFVLDRVHSGAKGGTLARIGWTLFHVAD